MTQPALKDIIEDIGLEATRLQSTAADPRGNVWVNASAGTGKTKVLTERVLRLLLPIEGKNDGTPPENILCVTFTKAGANEMITRVMKILSRWAVCTENKLVAELTALLGHDPSANTVFKARRLFARIIDLPGGLNITTIHGLCQSILGRFVLEAGLPPNFSVMEETEAQGLIKQARDNLVHDILAQGTAHPLYESFSWLAGQKNSLQINQILSGVLSDRQKLSQFFAAHPDYDGFLRNILNIDNVNEGSLTRYALYDDFPEDQIRQLAKAFEHGSPTNQKQAIQLYDFVNGDRETYFDDYKLIFLKADGDARKPSAVSAGAQKHNPQAVDIFIAECERLLAYEDKRNSLHIYRATNAILDIAHEITNRYQSLKTAMRKVDYDDLIHKTYALLTGPQKDWVLYKLDYGIDHILVDEAQDTSPDQWGILQALWDDFYTGQSIRSEDGINRTVFVVGDNKQSIFSFQGANLDIFNGIHAHLKTQVEQSQSPWADVPMNTSFRSTSAVLDVVDHVFDAPDLRTSLTQDPEAYRPHTAFRQGHAGQVEIWPLYKAPATEALPPWTLPLEVRESHNAQAALANRIAETIANWLNSGETLKSSDRPIAAGDIMILVRRRNALVDYLIRALKSNNIPVSGADRLVISNHIAVQDVLAALQFAYMPDDDLMLATLLKSPLIGWDDATLEDYAYDRDGTLWHEVKTNAPEAIVHWLSNLIESLSGQNAFMAVSQILNFKSAMADKSGWQAFVSRLGEDCLDPLEELITMAQNFDANNAGAGVQGFLHFMQTNTADIKRELDSTDNKVRIMTVHASKGLQAPIVFMPDTTATPKARTSDDGLLWINNDIPLWSPASQTDNQSVKSHKESVSQSTLDEYYRLMYVAMTRAEDRLIVCGTLNNKQKNIPDKSWYQCALNGMQNTGAYEQDWPHDPAYEAVDAATSHLIFKTDQTIGAKSNEQTFIPKVIDTLPDWVKTPLKPEVTPPRILKPSQDADEAVPVRSPLSQGDDSYRFRRGLLTHSLLQYLPDIAPENRAHAGERYLTRQAPDVSDEIKDSILSETVTILNDDRFAPFFGEGSLAEVPVTGTVTHDSGKVDIISGQIDRMLITNDTIWILDFKSNRPPPTDPEKVPNQYRKQLSAYKTLIQRIYPDHDIKCALLWTDGPFMTVLENL